VEAGLRSTQVTDISRQLRSIWATLNEAYFGGELIAPRIKIENLGKLANDFSGIFWVHEDERIPHIDINEMLLRKPLNEWRKNAVTNLLIHEMVHQYLWQRGIKDEIVEGVKEDKHSKAFERKFKQIMRAREKDLGYS
jgi:hypothetical protein